MVVVDHWDGNVVHERGAGGRDVGRAAEGGVGRGQAHVDHGARRVLRGGHSSGCCFRVWLQSPFGRAKSDVKASFVHCNVILSPLFSVAVSDAFFLFLLPSSEERFPISFPRCPVNAVISSPGKEEPFETGLHLLSFLHLPCVSSIR